MGRDTIREYLDAFAARGLLEGPVDELPDVQTLRCIVHELGSGSQPPQQTSSIVQWQEQIEALRLKGAGPTAIHDYLRLHHQSQYSGSLSAVKRLYLRLERESGPLPTDVAIPVETAPGEVAQVDFGYAGKRYDPVRGVLRKSWLFIMSLAYSRHMYADLVFDQKTETWLALHVAAFKAFHGVVRVVVPDNLKAAVVRAAFGVDDQVILNRSYRELARHFGFRIDPTPPRSPQKKGKAESDVGYVSGNFLATWETMGIEEDRRQLHRWVHEIAGQRRHGTTGRRPLELFEEQERDALLPLPTEPWEPVMWKKATVHRDSHVQIDAAFYSVPWRLLHQEVWVRCAPHRITIYHGDEQLWSHPRVPRGKRSTTEEHLPEQRRDLRHRSREHWILRARAMGEDVVELVEAIFGADDVLLQLRRVQAVVSHLETFPAHRARAAARRALHYRCLDYQGIKNILSRGLDLQPLEQPSTRAWSEGSRFARHPQSQDTLFGRLEISNVGE
jgi:transposase